MRRKDLTVRLAAAFAIVAVATAAIAAVVITVTWQHQFEVYVQRGVQDRADSVAAVLADAYAQAGSWDAVAFVNIAHLGLTGDYSVQILDSEGDLVAYTQDRMGRMMTGGTPADNAAITRAILSGRERGPKRDAVLLNAGAALYVGGKADTLQSGVVLAASLIDSGEALRKLDEFRAASQA